MKVLIAVGHGRRPNGTVDPGAVAGSKTEQNEGQKIVAVANAAADQLRAGGVTVKVIPAGGPNYIGTTTEANSWGADRVVEVHHDWSGAPRGMFGFWFPGSTHGKRMADAIRDRLIAELNYPHRSSWHRSHDGLYILRHTRMPTVLWECDRIGTMADHQRYGRALANGILVHLGRPIPGTPAPPPEPPPSSANITYHRYASAPLRRRTTRQPTHLWNFDAPTHAGMRSVKTFDRHTVVDIVGYAQHHDTGSRYMMTAFSFGDAPRGGPPAFTHGFNTADMEPVPSTPPPPPPPPPPPEPDPEPDPEPPDEVAELRAALRDIRDRAHDALT